MLQIFKKFHCLFRRSEVSTFTLLDKPRLLFPQFQFLRSNLFVNEIKIKPTIRKCFGCEF